MVSVWVDLENGAFEFIGQGKVQLKELARGGKSSFSFYDSKKKREVFEDVRKVEVDLKLLSGYNQTMNTSILIELILFPFIPDSKFSFSEIPQLNTYGDNPAIAKILQGMKIFISSLALLHISPQMW